MSKGKKIYFLVLILITILVTTFYFSYAIFSNTQEEHGKLNIVAGTLNYKVKGEDIYNNQIEVTKNTTRTITLTVTSLNEIDSKYELYYKIDSNKNVEVGYDSNTKDSVKGIIKKNASKEITVIIRNNSSNKITVTFGVHGGLANLEYDDIKEYGLALNELKLNDVVIAWNYIGNKTKPTSFPKKNSGYSVESVRCTNADGSFNNSSWKLEVTNISGVTATCTLTFTDTYRETLLNGTDPVITDKIIPVVISNTGVVTKADTSNYEKNFRLRMWVSDDTDFSDGSMNDKTFTLTVNVYADGKVVTDNLDTTNTLDSITVSDCTLDPVFNSATTEYSCTVPNSVTSVTVNATATSSKSKVRGLGSKDLTVGKNTLPIRVIAEDGSEKIYNINITRKAGVVSNINIFGKSFKVVDAEPTLTTSSNNTSDASGLYASNDTNTGKPTYYFRGNVTNNYVKFVGQTWRIVRVNEDGTIRIIMQDGINSNSKIEFNSNYNNYTYMYYTNSQVKSTLESWYQTNIGSKTNLASSVASGNYYCEQAKTKQSDSWTSGSATMTTYSKYTPDFKCSSDGNNKGVVNASVGLLNYDEVVYAGGYYEKSNNSYYLYNNTNFWTMSPTGFESSRSSVWVVITAGDIDNRYVNNITAVRPVLNLTANTQISDGNGTKENPFVVE